jgi:pimeloyl-ACP methyl ester carboxylesterase
MASLPPALDADVRPLETAQAGRLVYYTSGPREGRPLLLVHSVNAAAAASEVRPLFERYRKSRPLYALDLPGFGLSERSDRPYTPRLMTDAVLAVAAEIARLHAGPQSALPLDLLGVSLGSEFCARAACEQPASFRTVALISPTGFNRTAPLEGPPGSDRGMDWLRTLLGPRLYGPKLFEWLTVPGSIRWFLEKTWGRKQIDEELWRYCVLTTRAPGAHHAPLWFLSGHLFSKDSGALYQRLSQPVFMAHGVRGDFTDYRLAAQFAQRPNWTVAKLDTGALPHFEKEDELCGLYDTFLARAR